jgi:uncharacterized protein (DUF934 family)
MQLIHDGRFVRDEWTRTTVKRTLSRGSESGIEIEADIQMDELRHLAQHVALLVVCFSSATDGRGFSIARALRDAGFRGELRASGPLIADQYDFLLRSGFDSVEIPEALALRQSEGYWHNAMRGLGLTYQARGADRTTTA